MTAAVQPLFVGGKWLDHTSTGTRFPVVNPVNQEVLATVPCAGEEETLIAIESAVTAQGMWSEVSANERADLLWRAADLMSQRREDLARTITLEEGKPLAEARGEVDYAASFFTWFAGEALRVQGQVLSAPHARKRAMVLYRPVGVTAAITPWNFPAAMITRKAGAAVAAGCAMVIKPSELTPLTALKLAEVLEEAGTPPGLISVVAGPDPVPIADTLLVCHRVRKISFTGSTEVGKSLMARGADTLKRLSLELGGHAPFIVFDDADIELAAEQAVASKMRNMGQTCVCANRFYVQRGVLETFTDALVARLGTMVVGDGMSAGVTVGPLINVEAVAKVHRHIEDALGRGACLHYRGDVPQGSNFVSPTILTDVAEPMLVTREETFGPVLPLMAFDTEDEVVRRANATEYGLAAYYFTRDAGRLFRLAERLEFGVLGANDGTPSTAQAPFGGMKGSGYGREGGHLGIYEYLDAKYVSLGQTEHAG